MKYTIIILTVLVLIILSSIFFSKKTKSEVATKNIQTLLNVELAPIKQKWITTPLAKGTTDYELVAVLTYKKENQYFFKKLKESSKTITSSVRIRPNIVKEWFPDYLKQLFSYQEERLTVKTAVYSAENFSKGAYKEGYFFITDKYEIVIVMYAL